MKKVNKILVVGLIILLFIIIVLCLVIKKISNNSTKESTKNTTTYEEKNSGSVKKNNTEKNSDSNKASDELFNDASTYERLEDGSSTPSITNNYYYITNEGDVTNYIEDVVDKATTVKEKSRLTKAFETLSDFIFYNGTIKGYTFDELTDISKEKVMNAWYKLDSYIESHYPDYKSNLKNKYQEVKEAAVEKYHEINTEENRQKVKDAYEEAKETAGQLKEKTAPYVEEFKEQAKEDLGQTKEDYKTLYQKFKEWLNSD